MCILLDIYIRILGHLFIYLYICCLFPDTARNSDWSTVIAVSYKHRLHHAKPNDTRTPDTALRYLPAPFVNQGSVSHNQATVHHVANTCHRTQPNDAVTWLPIIQQEHGLQIAAETASLQFGYLLAFVRQNLQGLGWERVFHKAIVHRAILP
jgi:hypothetical protein